MPYQELKIAVMLDGRRGYVLERAVGFWPGKLSKAYAGIILLTEEEKEKFSKEMGKSKSELFPEKHQVEVA